MAGIERGDARGGVETGALPTRPGREAPAAPLVELCRLVLAWGREAEERERQAARATETPPD